VAVWLHAFYTSALRGRFLCLRFSAVKMQPRNSYPRTPDGSALTVKFVISLSLFLRGIMHGSKDKVVPVLVTERHSMKAYWGSGGIAPLIL